MTSEFQHPNAQSSWAATSPQAPFPAETLALLVRLPNARYIRGNLEREVVDAFDASLKGRERLSRTTIAATASLRRC
jgi:hypothetical protein